jgi:predicted transcriptional regulator
MNANNDMSGRVNVVLPDDIYEVLKQLADNERRSQSQTAAILIEEALAARELIKGNSKH